MNRVVALVACLAGWMLLGVAEATAAVPIVGPVVSDGERWGAWSTAPGVVVVLDDRTGIRRRLSVPDCSLAGVGGGLVLLQCRGPGGSGGDPVIVDVRTGVATNVGGPDLAEGSLESMRFAGVGAAGLLVDVRGYHYGDLYAFDWRSRTRYDLDDPRRTVDLDRRGLTRPLCAPLKRSPDPYAGDPYVNGPPYLPMAVHRRWAVESARGAVRLWRCGHARPRVLARCECGSASIGSGMVAWSEDRARALDLASGRRRSWRVPANGYTGVAQAGRTLLLWSQPSAVTDPPGKLRIVRWPRPASQPSSSGTLPSFFTASWWWRRISPTDRLA